MKTRDFRGNAWEYDCMGCAIARQSMQAPGGSIWKSELFCVHQDPLIPLAGFLVIASTRHCRSIGEMNEAEYAEFFGLVRQTQAAIRQATQVEYLTLVQEEHSSHFHLWFFPWLPVIIKDHGGLSLAKIRGIMAELARQPISMETWSELEKTIQAVKVLMN